MEKKQTRKTAKTHYLKLFESGQVSLVTGIVLVHIMVTSHRRICFLIIHTQSVSMTLSFFRFSAVLIPFSI